MEISATYDRQTILKPTGKIQYRDLVTALNRSLKGGDPAAPSGTATLLRLHPSHRFCLRHLPPLRVSSATLGTPNSHGVTGGVYKTRERIHPDMLIRDY